MTRLGRAVAVSQGEARRPETSADVLTGRRVELRSVKQPEALFKVWRYDPAVAKDPWERSDGVHYPAHGHSIQGQAAELGHRSTDRAARRPTEPREPEGVADTSPAVLGGIAGP